MRLFSWVLLPICCILGLFQVLQGSCVKSGTQNKLGPTYSCLKKTIFDSTFLTNKFCWAEISDGPHKGGALEGLDQIILCLCIIQCKEIYLFQYFLFLSFCFVSHVFYYLQLEYNSQSCNLRLLDGTVYYS